MISIRMLSIVHLEGVGLKLKMLLLISRIVG